MDVMDLGVHDIVNPFDKTIVFNSLGIETKIVEDADT